MDSKPAPNWWARHRKWLVPAGWARRSTWASSSPAASTSPVAGGKANLAIPLQGSKASSTLYLEARQSAGSWTYSTLTVRPDGAGEPINLLGSSL
jgi:hypothetical protein